MTANGESVPPTQYLVMESLVARWRLGEAFWTFPSSLRPALRALAERGLVRHKSGFTEHTERAWLTDAGLLAWLGDDYEPPLSKAVQWYCGFGTRTLIRRFAEAERAHEELSHSGSSEGGSDGR